MITLHPTHGVNPTLCVCFWCGQERGDLALLGLNKGREAEKFSVVDYEPCDACHAKMQQGICIMECEEVTPVNRRDSGKRPTGRYVVIKEDAVRRIFQPEEMIDAVLKARKAHIEPAAFNMLFGEAGL